MLTDPRLNRSLLYAADAPPVSQIPNLIDEPGLLNLDGPEHQRLRSTVQKALAPRAIARWRPWVTSVVDQLVDGLVTAGPQVDAIASFTRPLPIEVICRLLNLDGLDPERLRHWSSHAFSATAYSAEEVQAGMREFGAFVAARMAEHRGHPGDDLTGCLTRAAQESDQVSEAELVMLVLHLVLAGYETTATALGNALVFLLDQRPESWEIIGQDEAAAASAVEQMLRMIPLGEVTTTPGMLRRAAEDLDIGGVRIPAGSVVAANTAIANRDPDVYPDSLGQDLFAPVEAPSLTFGAGPHYCPGASLTRMEMEVALHRLARRLPTMRLAVSTEEISWHQGELLRSPATLPVVW
ncbi:cytochrome P450 [Streptomyces sp. NPDC051554]|uniref:cytochrome P450 n=1 Tax=Streptomyces sp. NPDC051554 TaxID=3365656 RepID=UPI00379C002F